MMKGSRYAATLSRRALLAGMGGGAAWLWAAPLARASTGPGEVSNPVFLHGVASGDPDATSVVLWTRVTAPADLAGEWEIAREPSFAEPLRRGTFQTGAERDHTVKVLAEGLEPGTRYYYRFHALGWTSPTGRTRTLPVGRLDRLGLALAACSNFAFGHFNAYDAIARDQAVDFVLHTGDYIYEYGGANGWGAQTARRIGRVHQPENETVTLDDYRQRHAQYKTDRGLQAMHRAHPLLACWDDHESANNPWTGGAQNHQPATEGDWNVRREASIRAYFEWMPVREPSPGRSRMQFWRKYDFGDLAMLHTLETRHTARARQVDYAPHMSALLTPEGASAFRADVLGAPNRPILAAELEADLEAALSRSVHDGQAWRLIGNPMLIARTDVPDLAATGLLPDPMPALRAAPPGELARMVADPVTNLAWKGRFGLPASTDAWDGYPWARQRLYDLGRRAGAGDLVFLSGDSHSFWANALADDGGRPAGVELGTAGITSPGNAIASGFDRETAARIDAAYARHNREVLWTDDLHNGYVRLVLRRRDGTANFVAVNTVDVPDYAASTIREFRLVRRDGTIALA